MKAKIKRYRTIKEVTNIPLLALEYLPIDGLKTKGNKTYAIFETTIITKQEQQKH